MRYFYYIILVVCLSSCDFHSAEDYFNEASKLEKSGDFERAILFHDKALKINPKSIACLINRGADKAEVMDYNGAIKDYTSILDIDKNNTLALYSIGDNYSELKDYSKAIDFYSKSLNTKGAIKNRSFEDKANSINLVFNNNNEYSVQDYYIYFERGIAYLENNEYDNAIADLKTSILNENGIADCHFLLGRCYLGKKDSINACENFIKSAKLGDKEAREMLKKHCIKNLKQ